jgi:hypothetical protein
VVCLPYGLLALEQEFSSLTIKQFYNMTIFSSDNICLILYFIKITQIFIWIMTILVSSDNSSAASSAEELAENYNMISHARSWKIHYNIMHLILLVYLKSADADHAIRDQPCVFA